MFRSLNFRLIGGILYINRPVFFVLMGLAFTGIFVAVVNYGGGLFDVVFDLAFDGHAQ